MNIGFTGPAFDNAGMSVIRADLIAACYKTGKFTIQTGVKCNTQMVVASRTDTVKAKSAQRLGPGGHGVPAFLGLRHRDRRAAQQVHGHCRSLGA